jgi:drug/metabolite transporter (DMT)-like permease
MSWRVLLGLVACNAVWATNPAMGKIVMQEFTPMHTSWLRYFSALLTIIVILPFFYWRKPQELSPLSVIPKNFAWLLSVGLITFCLSSYVQYKGLSLTSSTANVLIVAMEPLFAVLLAWIFLGEKMKAKQLLVFAVAIVGFLLLSNVRPGELAASFSLFNAGNLFLLIAMPSEAFHTIGSRKIAGRVTPLSFFAFTLPIGFFAFTTYLLFSGHGLPDLNQISLRSFLALLWMGPLGTTITYSFWTLALVEAPVAAVALTLFVQPILGATNGMIFLGERLDSWQSLGAALILGALVLQTTFTLKDKK